MATLECCQDSGALWELGKEENNEHAFKISSPGVMEKVLQRPAVEMVSVKPLR